ncbi:sensor domain-containing diguanylate cyclase [Ureibacillus acetophenoni]|uniref:Diguanylate cyclase with GAF sensor n=1 Tax=Ureibacillus acetophenoni TaxID=614649 RepID=A0A285U4I6_9BACL|nr:diguanylate cyclase [Ureibacillus acetophenoni]SOC36597.1 diguanylate cyclase with GAF sensor [Ureibacillus acetophenoni]
MKVHQQSINHLISDLLAICAKSVDELSINNSQFELIEKCLKRYLDIEYSYFLIYDGNKFICPNDDVSFDLRYSGIPSALLEKYFVKQTVNELPNILKEKEEFKELTHMILLKGPNENNNLLLIKESSKWKEFTQTEYFEQTMQNISNIVQMLNKTKEIRLNENQYRKLYNMTDLFHSTMDINMILENVLNTIQENFPTFQVELILSNDQDRQTTISIKQFDYLTERPSTIEAFVSGNITTEKASDLNYSLLNAPIKGRQAIYGILQVSAHISYVFSPIEKNFVSMLANTAGNALENAKLYHQSHRLVSDLQLINETSHRLNMNLNMNDMLKLLQKQLIKSFQPMELCFVFIENNTCKLTEACTEFFKTPKGREYIKYVSNHFNKTQDSLFVADFNRLISKDVPYNSLMAIPLIVEQRIYGFSIVLHSESYFFSFDSYKLMQSLIQHSSLAIANSMLRSQLQQMVDHDHLTKLYARSYLDQFVEKSLKTDDSGMFLLVDIDNFKRVNDTYGHHVGDEVLIQIGDLLLDIVGTRGICARWGGEEMAVYVPNILDDESIRLAENIVDTIPIGTNPTVTISAGMIVWHKDERPDFQTIFLQADTALYYSKNNGKNRVYIYDEELEKTL